ncbi:MAG: hypothetical protein ACI978_002297 [Oleispira sp.]|jgi:hypothetical protein
MLKIKYVVCVGTMGLAVIVRSAKVVMKRKVTAFVLNVNIAITRRMVALARPVKNAMKKRAAALVMNKVIF